MPVFEAQEFEAWTGGTWSGDPGHSLHGICHDTRTLKSGECYLAVDGDRFDGHTFVNAAAARGAVAAIVRVDWDAPDDLTLPLLRVPSTRRAVCELAAGYRALVSADFVGITGSVGKTTIKEMCADLLQQVGKTARTLGNWNNDLGLPLSLLAMDRDAEYGVFEVGMNAPGELEPLCALLRPGMGILTEVGMAHVEQFAAIEDIAVEKAALLRALPDNGFAVLDRDSRWYNYFETQTTARIVRLSMRGAKAEYTGRALDGEPRLLEVSERARDQVFRYRISLPGRYMMENALRVIALGRELGMDPEVIDRVTANFRPPGMRWREETHAGVHFINDAYNANPISMHAALSAFEETPVQGNKWLVLGGMRELGKLEAEAHREVGVQAAQGPWAGVLCVGDLGVLLHQGLMDGGGSVEQRLHLSTPDEAAAWLQAHTREGDAVLLKASRTERLERTVDHFSTLSASLESSQ